MSAAAAEATNTAEVLNPGLLLDILIGKLGLKNDAHLARVLEVAPPVLSKIRHNRLAVGATILIAMHEVTGMSIADLRGLMGDRRAKFRDTAGAKAAE
jgi:plasmid maintenance system antidote protein VapI